jgi:RHS repeat-associated protein
MRPAGPPRRVAASTILGVIAALSLYAPSASASNLKTRVWDFFEDCPLCTDGEPDLSQQSSSGKTASNASDCGWRNLFYNRFRYYDPKVGRYVSPDPLGTFGGLNLYAYAPNTTGWLDPYGLVKKKGTTCEGTQDEEGNQGNALGPRGGRRRPEHEDIVQERLRRRAARREARSRLENDQKPSGEGRRDHESARRGPRGVRPTREGGRNRERNVGIDEEHSRVAKGTGGTGARKR